MNSRVFLVVLLPVTLVAQTGRQVAPVHPWPAPLYWQPTEVEARATSNWASAQPESAGITPQAQAPANSLVFVAITPCRVVDTRTGQGFMGSFGPPSLAGGASRTFPIQSSPNCAIPSIAQAYSFNVTVVPPGFLGFITVYPTGAALPNASTLNDSTGLVLANAAIVPAGTSGSVNVYANNNTDLIVDINGYYASQTGITLSQGTAAAPSLSFSGDAVTGIFSTGANTLNFATNGTNRLTVRSDGDLDIPGSIRKNGTLFFHTLGSPGNNTGMGLGALAVNAGSGNTASGFNALGSNTSGGFNTASGVAALFANNTGSTNTALGFQALAGNNIGENNIGIGYQAGYLLHTTSNNIMIGNQSTFTDDSVIRLGDVQTNTFIAGINGVTIAGGVSVLIDSSGHLGTILSSRRYKEDIHDMGDASSNLLRLRPVTYRYKRPYEDGSKPLDYGLIAEEVAEVYPDLVVKNKDGQIETVQYQKLTPMLLNEVQKLHVDAEKQSQHVHQQDETIRLLQEQNRETTARLAALEALVAIKVPPTPTSGQ